MAPSGKAANRSPKKVRIPSGARSSARPTSVSVPPGFQCATASSSSLAAQGFEVGPGDRSGALPPASARLGLGLRAHEPSITPCAPVHERPIALRRAQPVPAPCRWCRMSSVPVYRGRFGPQQAERLLWRAGFGPRPGEARKLAKKGLKDAVHSLTRPRGAAKLRGPEPHDDDGLPLAPTDAWGHDHLWWLDRMVRTTQPLIERMTLNWHDWFATGDVGQSQLNLDQNELFRKRGMGSFADLLADVTVDPAMLVWLSGNENTKRHPNENYARELMELFTLGADAGYTEDDVREQARALTGWTNDWDDDIGSHNFHFDAERYDSGSKRIFGRSGTFDWQDSCRLCLQHPAHDDYFVAQALVLLHPQAAAEEDARRAQEALPEGLRDPARGRVDPPAPGLLRGPADDQAADRPDRRPAARAQDAGSGPTAGPGSPATPASASSTRRTSPAGTRSAGSTRLGSSGRWNAAARITDAYEARGGRLSRRGDGEAGGREGAQLLGHARRCRRRPRRSSCGSPTRSRRSSRTSRSGSPTGRCARTRCGC